MNTVSEKVIAPSLNNDSIQEAVLNVFKQHGFGPFDLEAVIHFALRDFHVTPFTYLETSNLIRAYITTHFECRRGSLKSGLELNLRRVIVYYRE